jgi:tRNA threonylcarbamoyladenosine biosynthesis protein TsaB
MQGEETVPEMPRLLILETSGRIGQVALAEGDRLGLCRRLDQAQKHARDLAPGVAELLKSAGWRARDLQGILVSRGPGSYTGLRVGIMSAKTLAHVVGCPLIAIDTFDALAAQAPENVQRLDVLADAQQDKVYAQAFDRTGGSWQALEPLAIRPFAAWLAARDPLAWVTGPGLSKWESHLPADALRLEPARWEPQPASLLQLGLARLLTGQRDDPLALEPLYLRASAAEQQWQALGR